MLVFAAKASDSDETPPRHTVLIYGCTPLDKSLEGSPLTDTADFMQLLSKGQEDITYPENVFNIDVNTPGPRCDVILGQSRRSYSDPKYKKSLHTFLLDHQSQYDLILIDWFVHQKILRVTAWNDFFKLLTPQGRLIFPVVHQSFETGEVDTKEKAEIIMTKLKDSFPKTSLHEAKPFLLSAENADVVNLFYKRDQGIEFKNYIQSMQPVFIVISK